MTDRDLINALNHRLAKDTAVAEYWRLRALEAESKLAGLPEQIRMLRAAVNALCSHADALCAPFEQSANQQQYPQQTFDRLAPSPLAPLAVNQALRNQNDRALGDDV